MKTLPSKELLSEVLGVDVWEIFSNEYTLAKSKIVFGTNANTKYEVNDSSYSEINIYELGDNGKKWAFSKGIIIKSYTALNVGVCELENKNGLHIETFNDNTEIESIIKSCEWLFEQIKGQL